MKLAFLSLLVFPLADLPGQLSAGDPSTNGLFQQNCAVCHGSAWEGGKGGSLLRARWKYFAGDEDSGLAGIIRKGIPEMGMQPFAGTLNDADIHALVSFIKERRRLDQETLKRQPPSSDDEIHLAGPYAFRLETVTKSSSEIWSLAFLPDGRLLYTEKEGALHIMDPFHPDTDRRIEGTPEVWNFGLGGLLDVVVHPDFLKNGWVYLTYTESVANFFGRRKGMTAVVRGRIQGGKWVDQQDIFHLPEKYFSTSGDHFGCRLVIKDGFIYFSIGDRGEGATAQDLASPNGKIYRLAEDGKIPKDNPFPNAEGPLAAIWCYGNRNPEGLVFQPGTGILWEAEHGPRGGDEINVIERGGNYGWPIVSFGEEDHGGPPTSPEPHPGMEQPKHDWTPSIAVCAIAFYDGSDFPLWKGNLFAGGLRSQELHRLTIKEGEIIDDQVVLDGQGRIRDVVSGPDGALYLIFNSVRGDESRIARLVACPPVASQRR